MRISTTLSGEARGGAELVAVGSYGERSGRSPLTMGGGGGGRGDSTSNLCKDVWPTLRAEIEKCSQVLSELHSPF